MVSVDHKQANPSALLLRILIGSGFLVFGTPLAVTASESIVGTNSSASHLYKNLIESFHQNPDKILPH